MTGRCRRSAPCRGTPSAALERRCRRRWPGSSTMRRRMASSPIVTVNLWFDGPVAARRRSSARRRADALGRSTRARIVRRARAGHLSVVASGADDIARLDNAADDRAPWRSSRAAFRRCDRGSCSGRSSCASIGRRSRWRPAARRVRDRDAADGFFLAGDWTDTGLPGDDRRRRAQRTSAAEAVWRLDG